MYLWKHRVHDNKLICVFVCTHLSHQVQEELVHHISMLRSQADTKKLKLSKLRMEVLEGPTESTNLFLVQGFIWAREGAKAPLKLASQECLISTSN